MVGVLLLIVRPPSRLERFLPLAGCLATGALAGLALALGASLLLAGLLHFFVAPALLAPKAARTLLPLQLLVLPASVFLFAALGVSLLPVLGSEALVGVLAGVFYTVEPWALTEWVGPDPRQPLT
jgi:hypothetical protein